MTYSIQAGEHILRSGVECLMAKSKQAQVAQFLNLCNRVEVLSECIHEKSGSINDMQLNGLMEKYYPSLESFFLDVKEENQVVSIDTFIGPDKVVFTAHFASQETKTFTYNQIDTEIWEWNP